MGLGGTVLSRPSWVEVDLSAVAHNVRKLAGFAADAAVCAVVKADAYGHGAPEVAAAALAHGATWLAVATTEEGVQLRERGITAPVLLLSEPPADDLETVVAAGLTPTLYRLPTAAALAQAARRLGKEPFAVQIKIDTGMHRLGMAPSAFPQLWHRVNSSPPLRVAGVWSHFAVAETDPVFTRHQISVYEETLDALSEGGSSGIQPVIRHLANTPATLLHPESHLDMVRTGLGIYGLYPHPATEHIIDLRPALRIVSRVAHLAPHPAGTRPSYGRIRPLPPASMVATLPVGYADGVPRSLSERGEVLIRGRRWPLAGRVTMDQLVVAVEEGAVEVGDQAVLVGAQGSESISLDEWAALSDTINYEVASRIGPRLPRRYFS